MPFERNRYIDLRNSLSFRHHLLKQSLSDALEFSPHQPSGASSRVSEFP
jgi:hypothetical protein